MDNYDLLSEIIPVLQETELTVKCASITDKRMYLKCIFESVQAEVIPGRVVASGTVISNSEVGAGALKVENFVWEYACKNGLITGKSLAQIHVGRRQGMVENVNVNYIQNDTREAEDKAFALKARDAVKALTDRTNFDLSLNKLRAASERKIEVPIQDVMEVTEKKFGLRKGETQGVLSEYIENAHKTGGNNQYSLVNAVTAVAREVGKENQDRQTELERIGNDILDMPEKDIVQVFASKAS